MIIKKFAERYCTFCGSKTDKNSELCPNCGKRRDDNKYIGVNQMGAGGIGYSVHADDTSFKKFKGKSAKFGFIFLIVVSIIIAAFLMIGENVSFEIAATVVGIIWAFDIIWFIAGSGKRKDWEGVVESKKNYTETNTRRDNNGDENIEYTDVYKITFRTNEGKKKTVKDYNNSRRYDYFKVGDKLRFIGNLRYYEKYDKSQDPFIPCAGCSSERDARENYCGRCGCIMLKGKAVSVEPQYQSNELQQKKFCSACGAQINTEARFCKNCGTELISS